MLMFSEKAYYQTANGQQIDLIIDDSVSASIRELLTPDGKKLRRESYKQNDIEGAYVRNLKTDYTDMPDGTMVVEYNNGVIKHEETVVNGKLNGYIIGRHGNGELAYGRSTKDDKLHGPFLVCHSNGETAREGNYVEGNLDGLVPHYGEDGKLLRVDSYSNGRKHGRQVTIKDNHEIVTYEWHDKKISQQLWATKENFNDIKNGDIKSAIQRISGTNKTKYEALKL